MGYKFKKANNGTRGVKTLEEVYEEGISNISECQQWFLKCRQGYLSREEA